MKPDIAIIVVLLIVVMLAVTALRHSAPPQTEFPLVSASLPVNAPRYPAPCNATPAPPPIVHARAVPCGHGPPPPPSKRIA